ncbi:MAG: hypothetical protein WCD70_16470 [Alphaproteobacteria bacterium]
MAKTLAEILGETLATLTPPESYAEFSKSLTRPAWRKPQVLPVVQKSPENLGPMPTYKPS